jgi:hypothetical protein
MVSLSVVPFVHDGLPDFGARGGVVRLDNSAAPPVEL